jgi:FkbM family methyltransferase
MKQSQKVKIALELSANPNHHDLISRVTGCNKNEILRIENKFKRNGYLAFCPSMLEISVSALSALRGGGLKVIQIGTNNGRDYFNPLIHHYAVKALLVEPIPQLIDEIKKNYSAFSGELIIENSAVSDECLDAFILNVLNPDLWDEYRVNVGRSATEIASINEGTLIKKISARLKLPADDARKLIMKIICPVNTLATLAQKYDFDYIDVLQIDCEGHDLNVIKSLGAARPQIINFESMNLDQKQWVEWKSWAHQNGYGFIQGPTDTLAIKGAHFMSEF